MCARKFVTVFLLTIFFNLLVEQNSIAAKNPRHANCVNLINSFIFQSDRLQVSNKKRVFRALSIDFSTVKEILNIGLDSHFVRLRKGYSALKMQKEIEALASEGLMEILADRFTHPRIKMEKDIFLSVSKHADIAAAVASRYYGKLNPHVYIFEIEVQEDDIISLGKDMPFAYPDQLAKNINEGLKAKIAHQNGEINTYEFGPEVEQFLVYSVIPEAIKAVYKVNPVNAPTYQSISHNNGTHIQLSDDEYLKLYTEKIRF